MLPKWAFDREFTVALLMFVGILGALTALWVAASYFEARAYNRVTGASVSTFDAMFIELRVQEGAQR